MKKTLQRLALLVSPLVTSLLLTSCADPGYPSGGYYSSSGSSHGIYNTLPTSFVGSAYFHNGRYYSGGNYQTGRYNYNGRSYNSRYSHNGRYIYGGKYQQYNPTSRRSRRYNTSRSGVYRTLPASFSGSAYHHDGRYYSGGKHQTGRYNHKGRTYNSRYQHDGKYIYGGKYQQYDNSTRRTSSRNSSRRSDNDRYIDRSGRRTSSIQHSVIR